MVPRVLEADSMWLHYGEVKVLQNVYLKVETGQVVGLLGRNGVGKSSLLRMMFGTLRGQNQSVRVDRRYIAHPYREAGLIRYLPQHHFVPSELTVSKVGSLYGVDFLGISHVFPEVLDYRKEPIGKLSGGTIRLIETLLILLSPVAFVLLDEPFTHLSPVATEQLKEVIREEQKRKGILLSDHAYQHVLDLSDEVYLIVPVGRTIRLKEPRVELTLYGYTL